MALTELNKEFGRPRVIYRRITNINDIERYNLRERDHLNKDNLNHVNVFNLDRGAGATQGSGVHMAGQDQEGLSGGVHGPWDVRGSLHGTKYKYNRQLRWEEMAQNAVTVRGAGAVPQGDVRGDLHHRILS